MAGTLVVDALNSSVSNTPPVFKANGVEVGTLCRAWVNFNGTGTVAIRGSFNVSSITDNGTGDYTVNFTTAMPDANYSVTTTSKQGAAGQTLWIKNGGTYSTSAVQLISGNNSSVTDIDIYGVAVFR